MFFEETILFGSIAFENLIYFDNLLHNNQRNNEAIDEPYGKKKDKGIIKEFYSQHLEYDECDPQD